MVSTSPLSRLAARHWLSGLLVLAWPGFAAGQSAGYFMPPKQPSVAARPDILALAVPDGGVAGGGAVPDQGLAVAGGPPSIWRNRDLDGLGIGVVTTGVSLLFDHGVNQYTTTKISPSFRNDVATRAETVLTLGPLAFAAATMFQSPVADPRLAHASSVAMTAALLTTVEVTGLKYAIGRQGPRGANGSPFVARPFSAGTSLFSDDGATGAFPSGHVALAFAVMTPYAELYNRPWLYALPAATGVAAVLAGHGRWLSDDVAGGFIGWLTADLTRRYFPDSDFGLMLFGDGRQVRIGYHAAF